MTPPVFPRQDWTQLWITLSSNESLGVLDSGYIEDYDGTDGQLSLFSPATGIRTPFAMAEVPAAEDEPHEVFRGWVPLAGLPNGEYQIQGRVRDVVGNYAILSAVASPFGGELVEPMGFILAPGRGPSVTFGPLKLTGGAVLSLSMARVMVRAPMTGLRRVPLALGPSQPVGLQMVREVSLTLAIAGGRTTHGV